ncbi:MAG: DNA methyltransferase [Acidobacteria bacterium]|nr:MAG: DNA methyltransferase [Acidobacteriota bacterium]
MKPLGEVVNVASVPQRSPFRYPGGKTWLVPRVRQWLASLETRPAEFIEPFAGGGIVSLTVAAEKLARHVTMIELDEQVAAVWRAIITDGDGVWLADRIANFGLIHDSLGKVLSEKARTVRERAFQTILKNRTYHGGILAPGSAPLKSGENGKGIASRWYADTLKKRILAINDIRLRLKFVEGDGMEEVRKNAHRRDAVFFVDPPYTAGGKQAGRRLYTHSELDHEELFKVISEVTGDFLMTYDNTDDVRDLARRYGFDFELVAMQNTHLAKMTELLIGRNLDWARSARKPPGAGGL